MVTVEEPGFIAKLGERVALRAISSGSYSILPVLRGEGMDVNNSRCSPNFDRDSASPMGERSE